jgi:hypothetical protein
MHSYDDVFQATAEAIERCGWFMDSVDKNIGTCVFSIRDGIPCTMVVKIEAVESAAGPQALVKFNYSKPPRGLLGLEFRGQFPGDLFRELQKVLATYR